MEYMDPSGSELHKPTKIIRKIARIWSLVIISIASFIIIAEIIGTRLNPDLSTTYPWYENLIPLSMFLGVVGLGLAWRWEKIGSLLTIICLLATYGMYVVFGGSGRGLLVVAVILLPILSPAILFLVCWSRSDRETKTSSV
jgi:hypothetical protein